MECSSHVDRNVEEKLIDSFNNNTSSFWEFIGSSSDDYSPLHVSAAYGFQRLCGTVIASNADVNSRDTNGWTALMHAARRAHVGIVMLLLANNADATLTNEYGASALLMAVASGNVDVVKCLLYSQSDAADEKTVVLISPMGLACLEGFNNIVELLISTQAIDLNKATPFSGLTPLMLAVAGGHISTARILIINDARVDISNSMKHTALDMALIKKDGKMEALLKTQSKNDHQPTQLINSSESSSCRSSLACDALRNIEKRPSNELSPLKTSSHYSGFAHNVSTVCTSQDLLNPTCFPVSYHLIPHATTYCSVHRSMTVHSPIRSSSCDPHTPTCHSPTISLHSSIVPCQNVNNPCCSPQIYTLFPISPIIVTVTPKKSKRRRYASSCSSWLRIFTKRRSRSAHSKPGEDSKLASNRNATDLRDFLCSLSLQDYIPKCMSQELSLETFLTLSEEDLVMIGIDDAKDRKLLLKEIDKRKLQWQKTKTEIFNNNIQQKFSKLLKKGSMCKCQDNVCWFVDGLCG